jgi:uncharacterized membrane protein YebE (DUF533 family)
MKRVTTLLLAIAALAASASLAAAGTPRIERREANQRARIQSGVESGQLTVRESMRLDAGQRHVDRMEARAKSDGRVRPAERARIRQAQRHESRAIHRLKHNDRVSGS